MDLLRSDEQTRVSKLVFYVLLSIYMQKVIVIQYKRSVFHRKKSVFVVL